MIVILTVYMVAVNIIAAAVCIYDKHQARRGGWRISEKFLFTISLVGGAIGMYLTMLQIRHKTKHMHFMVGLPIIILAHAAILFIAIDKGLILS